MNVTVKSSSLGNLVTPALRKELAPEPGHAVELTDLGVVVVRAEDVRALADQFAEEELLGDMASLQKDSTGVDNTIFVSTEAGAGPGVRIKIAIDPPDSFNAESKTASMAIHDFSIFGAYVPPHIVEQAKRFIEINREVLLLYWEAEIGTKEMIDRLKVPT